MLQKFKEAMQHKSEKRMIALGLIAIILIGGVAISRFGLGKATQNTDNQAVAVQAMRVVRKDASATYEYVGQVKAKSQVKVMSKVSGNIIDKMVEGGEYVYQGQPLFKIDNRQYQSAIYSAQAALAKAETAHRSSERTAMRYQSLLKLDAAARETTDSYVAQAEEDAATVETNRSALQQAIDNERDTTIISPMDGRIDINDVSSGNYVVAGSTTMATVSSVDPVWVQFTMSESEYLDLLLIGNDRLPDFFRDHLQIKLSNGGTYPIEGRVDQLDNAISETTGTITLKATFDNPNHMLAPGMFAKLIVHGNVQKNAIMIPQKAVKDVLNKSIVYVVTADNKAESRQVTLGDKAGDMVIITDGLSADDTVVVEGIDKIKKGSMLSITMVDASKGE